MTRPTAENAEFCFSPMLKGFVLPSAAGVRLCLEDYSVLLANLGALDVPVAGSLRDSMRYS